MESSENNLMFSLGGIPSGGNDVLFYICLLLNIEFVSRIESSH